MVEHNHADRNGGGIYAALGAVSVSGNDIPVYANEAGRNGGGIYSESGTVSVSGDAKMRANKAANNKNVCRKSMNFHIKFWAW